MTTQITHESSLDDLIEYHHIPRRYPNLYSPSSWYHAVKNRKTNGLNPAFKKVGHVLFVNVKMLAECINAAT